MHGCGEQVFSVVEKVVEIFGPAAQNSVVDQVLYIRSAILSIKKKKPMVMQESIPEVLCTERLPELHT